MRGRPFASRVEGHSRRRMAWVCRRCSSWHGKKANACARCEGPLVYCASVKEANRALELIFEERIGQIENLQFQPVFALPTVNHLTGEPVDSGVTYRADSSYTRGGERVVEDVKGRGVAGDDPVFHVKRKFFEAAYGIKLTIIRGGRRG